MQLIFLFFCLVFFNTPQAFPNEKSAPNELTLARQYHEKKQFGKAIQHYLLAAKTQNKKEKTEAYFRLALCYYDVGNWDRAIEAFEQSKETGKDFLQQSYYYIGLCYYAKRNKNKAMEAFQKAKDINTHPVLTLSADGYISRLKEAQEKKWSHLLSLGYTFDSNLTIETTSGIVSDPIVTNDNSHSNSFLYQPTYTTPVGKRGLLSGGGRSYATFNWDRSQKSYDIYQQDFSLSLKAPLYLWQQDIATTYTFLSNFTFSGVKEQKGIISMVGAHYDGTFQASYSPAKSWVLEFPFHMGIYDMKTGEGANDRDADILETGLKNILFFGNRQKGMSFGYTFLRNDSKGVNFRSQNHKMALGVFHPFFWSSQVSLQGFFTPKKFTDNSEQRKDNEYIYLISFARPIGPFGFTFNWIKTTNHSNLQRYDFKRHLFSFSFMRAF